MGHTSAYMKDASNVLQPKGCGESRRLAFDAQMTPVAKEENQPDWIIWDATGPDHDEGDSQNMASRTRLVRRAPRRANQDRWDNQ